MTFGLIGVNISKRCRPSLNDTAVDPAVVKERHGELDEVTNRALAG